MRFDNGWTEFDLVEETERSALKKGPKKCQKAVQNEKSGCSAPTQHPDLSEIRGRDDWI